MYAQHSVEAISRSDAGAKNLQVTSRRIDEIVEEAKGISRWKVEGGRWKEFVNVKVNAFGGRIRIKIRIGKTGNPKHRRF